MANCNTNLDLLPIELLHRIFDKLSVSDVYFHLSLVNQRLRAVAQSYPHFELVTGAPEFGLLCARLHASQVSSLCLSKNTDDNKANYSIDLFIQYQEKFNHLRSLDFTGIPDKMFSRLVDHLVISMPELKWTLHKIEDKCVEYSSLRTMDFTRLMLWLQQVRQISMYKPTALLALEKAVPTIERVSIETCTTVQMQALCEYRPNLRSVNVTEILLDGAHDKASIEFFIESGVRLSRHLTLSSLNGVKRRILYQTLFVGLASILSTLTHLRLKHIARDIRSLDSFLYGSSWERSLKASSPLIKSFAFGFGCNYYGQKVTLDDLTSILTSFQTEYWIKEKRWYVNIISSLSHGFRLFTKEFERDQYEMSNVNSALKLSTNPSYAISSETATKLTIDYSEGVPSLTSMHFGNQVTALHIRGPMQRIGTGFLSLNSDIRPYVDYSNVKHLRLGVNLIREDNKQLEGGFVRLFRNVTSLKIDRLENLQSLVNQRKKATELLTTQILALEIVEETNWEFCRNQRAIHEFCQLFSALRQLDLKVTDPRVMAIIIEDLRQLEEALFWFSENVQDMLMIYSDLCLSRTRLRALHWFYEIFPDTVHIEISPAGICSTSKGNR